jgi:hypothetical protein
MIYLENENGIIIGGFIHTLFYNGSTVSTLVSGGNVTKMVIFGDYIYGTCYNYIKLYRMPITLSSS